MFLWTIYKQNFLAVYNTMYLSQEIIDKPSSRAVAIRFGVIRSVMRTQERYTLGGPGRPGACSPRKILKFSGYEIASETNFGPIRCFSEAK